MAREEIKYEINKLLDHFSDDALGELLNWLKEIEAKRNAITPFTTSSLAKILAEDKELLTRLAQ